MFGTAIDYLYAKAVEKKQQSQIQRIITIKK